MAAAKKEANETVLKKLPQAVAATASVWVRQRDAAVAQRDAEKIARITAERDAAVSVAAAAEWEQKRQVAKVAAAERETRAAERETKAAEREAAVTLREAAVERDELRAQQGEAAAAKR